MCSKKEKGHVQNIKISDVKSSNFTKIPRVGVICQSVINSAQPVTISAVPDTGAEANVCGKRHMKLLQCKVKDLKPASSEKLAAANNSPIKTVGLIELEMKIGTHQTTENIIVCENQDDMLLSWKTCRNLGIIPPDFPRQISQISKTGIK